MRYTLLLLLLLFPFISNAQVNLVPNPSFEDTNYCPNGLNRLEACKDWYNFGNSPDYFNACNLNAPNVPYTGFAFQNARSGNSMIGLVTYHYSQENSKEFAGAILNQVLVIGREYFISFHTNFSYFPLNGAIVSNKLGLKFSTVPYDSCCHPPLTNSATLFTDLLISDTLNWICIKGNFIADSSYKYIILGNFFDDNHVDTINLSANTHSYSYYFIDDVCVSEDSTTCYVNQDSSSLEDDINIFYNYNESEIFIKSRSKILNISVYDALGQIIYFQFVNDSEQAINMQSVATGIYFIRTETTSKTKISKIFTYKN